MGPFLLLVLFLVKSRWIMALQTRWLDKKMTPEQQQKWLVDKDEQLESYRQESLFKQAQAGHKKYGEMKNDERICSPLHPIFLEDDSFDPEIAGRLLNDYEVALLSDLLEFPQARLFVERSRIWLKVGPEVLKEYENEYTQHLGLFLAKRLLQQQGTGFVYALNDRGRRALGVAKLMASKEIEEWESWRGMPSLYRLNERDQ